MHGGRPATTYRGKNLPLGFALCGDFLHTATLNGAIASGVNAGREAVKMVTNSDKNTKTATTSTVLEVAETTA